MTDDILRLPKKGAECSRRQRRFLSIRSYCIATTTALTPGRRADRPRLLYSRNCESCDSTEPDVVSSLTDFLAGTFAPNGHDQGILLVAKHLVASVVASRGCKDRGAPPVLPLSSLPPASGVFPCMRGALTDGTSMVCRWNSFPQAPADWAPASPGMPLSGRFIIGPRGLPSAGGTRRCPDWSQRRADSRL